MYKNNVGKWDKTFKIWDVASGTCKATLAGHSSWVTCVQLNPRVQGQLVSGSYDKTVRLWSVADGKCERTFTGHSDCVNAVAWRFDGKLLASGGDDNKIILWDPNKGERLKTLEGHRLAKFFFWSPPLTPAHRGRGVDDRYFDTLKTQKQCPDQRRQILFRRHHARFLQRGWGFWSKRQQRQAVECGNGRAAQEARGPQVTAFCQALRLDPPHRGIGVEKLTKNLTYEKMAAVASPASSSTHEMRGSSSVGRMTAQ